MAYRARFDCLWCGNPWTTRGADDLEGWAYLCPTCLGDAGANRFTRDRLRAGMTARAAAATAGSGVPVPALSNALAATTPTTRTPAPARRPYGAPQPAFPDDWFLRRGDFERGAIHDTAWAAELDMVTRWVDALPLTGRIAEPAAGVGFFSPLLAERGELHASDADGPALDHARNRLLAHRLRAHLHVADPWAKPTPGEEMDAVIAAFLLGRVRGAGLDPSAVALRARLLPGGLLGLVDLRPDPAGGPPSGTAWTYHEPVLVEAALTRAGFEIDDLRTTGRFFLLVRATAR